MGEILLRGGEVVGPEGIRRTDVLLRGETVAEVSNDLPASNDAEILDCSGKLLFPGVIDPHTHMGIPIKDGWSADGFESGTKSALHGGVTTILDFTVLGAGQTLGESVDERLKLAELSSCDYGLHCNVTRYSKELIAGIPDLIRRGITSFKVFTAYGEAGMRLSYDQIRDVAEVVGQEGGMLMVHAEDDDVILAATASLPQPDSPDPKQHGLSRPDRAEEVAVNRLGDIAEATGCPVYIVHLSSARGLQAARKHDGLILETCAQYLLLSDEVYGREDGRMYVASPPLRKPHDLETLWGGVSGGEIETLGTDHCPFMLADKPEGLPFQKIPNGIGGVETLFPLMMNQFIRRGLDLSLLVRLLSTHAAKRFGLFPRKGKISEGSDGDLLVVDPTVRKTIQAERLASVIDWTAYEGMDGIFPEQVFRRGEWMIRDGEWSGRSRGRFLPASPSRTGNPSRD